MGVESRDVLRTILKIAVHHHDPVAAGLSDARRDRRVLPEISAQQQPNYMRIGIGSARHFLCRSVRASVVDKNNLVVDTHRMQNRGEPPMQLGDAPLGSVNRAHHR